MGPYLLACRVCDPRSPVQGQLCLHCFKIWYDSGITHTTVLAREARWRKAEGFWPWSERSPTLAQIAAMEGTALPADLGCL